MDESSQSLKTTSTKRNAESCFYLFMHAQQRKAYRVEEKAVGFSLVLILAEQFLLCDRQKEAGSLHVHGTNRNKKFCKKQIK